VPLRKKALLPITKRMGVEKAYQLYYKDRGSVGAPSSTPKEKQIDALLLGVFDEFDFTPIFSGSGLRSRLVASDLYTEIMARAKDQQGLEGTLFTPDDVKKRWKFLISKQIDSIMAFKRRFEKLL